MMKKKLELRKETVAMLDGMGEVRGGRQQASGAACGITMSGCSCVSCVPDCRLTLDGFCSRFRDEPGSVKPDICIAPVTGACLA